MSGPPVRYLDADRQLTPGWWPLEPDEVDALAAGRWDGGRFSCAVVPGADGPPVPALLHGLWSDAGHAPVYIRSAVPEPYHRIRQWVLVPTPLIGVARGRVQEAVEAWGFHVPPQREAITHDDDDEDGA